MKTRVISAIVMISIAMPLVILGGIYFKIATILLSLMAMYEILNVRKEKKKIPTIIRIFSYISVVSIILLLSDYSLAYTLDYKFFSVLFLLIFFPIIFINNNEKYNISDALYVIGTILFIGISFNAFIITRNIDLNHSIYLLLITIITDTFALFGGKLIGNHKLCEKISPNKTVEGAVCGSFVGTVVATLFYMYIVSSTENILIILGFTLLLSIIGQLGDLFFSSIKRSYNFKDFSNLIPGHGGILDRFDSLIFVMVTYILFMSIL